MHSTAITDPLIPNLTGHSLFAIEAELAIAVLLIALIAPSLYSQLFRRVESVFRRIARRRALAVFSVSLLSLALRAALLPWLPIPVPGVHDEFSYLLQADTFAHGRLANPTPALWTHFETFHVLFHPAYVSKYPPMQGLILAAGQVLFGHPWFGVCLSVAVMCGAICWMLQGWLPPGWALVGGFLAVIRLGSFSYWANSYWGGAGAAVGGALVLGSLPRIARRLRLTDSLLMGLGLAILANSRPYEGLLLGLTAAGVFVFSMLRRQIVPLRVFARRVVLPIAACLAMTVAAMVYYNLRTTGSALVLPYQAYASEYWMAPAFLWEHLDPQTTAYHPKAIFVSLNSEETDLKPYEAARTAGGFFQLCVVKLKILDSFFLGPILTLPLIMLPWTLRDRRIRPLLWIFLVLLLGFLAETWSFPHYLAPATGLVYVLDLQCMRHLRAWNPWHRKSGLMIAHLIPVVCVIMLGLRLTTDFSAAWSWYGAWPGNVPRAQIEQRLDKLSGRELVLVRYSQGHSTDHEWVYNGADIDNAKVIWARDDGERANQELLRHYSGRTVWLLEPDQFPPQLQPYAAGTELARDSSPKNANPPKSPVE